MRDKLLKDFKLVPETPGKICNGVYIKKDNSEIIIKFAWGGSLEKDILHPPLRVNCCLCDKYRGDLSLFGHGFNFSGYRRVGILKAKWIERVIIRMPKLAKSNFPAFGVGVRLLVPSIKHSIVKNDYDKCD